MMIADIFRAAQRLTQVLTLAVVAVFAAPAMAANYPLELVSPRAVGTAPAAGNAAITSTHRIFKAYPGLEYNIRAVVIGGAYPYSFALSNAPAGMTINDDTGTIVWPNPQANATPTITVTDSEGTRVSSSWTITVTTSGFKFIDAVNGRSGATGSVSDPWRTISDMLNSSLSVAGDIVYFRNGTYSALNLPRSSIGTVWERIEINASNKPVAWLAYPGTTPVIDFGFNPGVEPGVMMRFNGNNVYIDGFETRNARVIGFQITSGPNSHYRVFRRLRMHDLNMVLANLDGANSSYIMMTSSYSDSDVGGSAATWAQYLTIQDCEFYNAPLGLGIKTYSTWKLLIEDNVFRDIYFATEIKADMPRFTYRGNEHRRVPGRSIGGNMHSQTTHGEILFNLVHEPNGEYALDVNQDGHAKRIDIYRNTFVGHVRVRNTDSADGPFRFYNNVIVNNDVGTPSGSHVYFENVADATRVQQFDNLVGNPSANIVDTSGSLSGSYRQYLGTRGHEIVGGAAPPSPPSNINVD